VIVHTLVLSRQLLFVEALDEQQLAYKLGKGIVRALDTLPEQSHEINPIISK
jgi:hypothetical protein